MRIRYDKTLYSKEALLKAAYHFTDKAYVYLGVEGGCFFVDLPQKTAHRLRKKNWKMRSRMSYWHR